MTISPPLRRAAVLVAVLAALAGCGGSSARGSSGSAHRPSTTARLQITAPTPNQVTGPDLTIAMNLLGGTVVPATTVSGPLRGDQGHIHVSLDGQLVSMAYGTTQDLHGLAAGSHNLQAEFVATDHQPFANRVVAGVVFTVQR